MNFYAIRKTNIEKLLMFFMFFCFLTCSWFFDASVGFSTAFFDLHLLLVVEAVQLVFGLGAPQLVDDLTGPLLEGNAGTDGSFASMTYASFETCSLATSGLASPFFSCWFLSNFPSDGSLGFSAFSWWFRSKFLSDSLLGFSKFSWWFRNNYVADMWLGFSTFSWWFLSKFVADSWHGFSTFR